MGVWGGRLPAPYAHPSYPQASLQAEKQGKAFLFKTLSGTTSIAYLLAMV
ncbi:hypothetical protein KSB_11920 [Ktedonobacter robiniae]|uniref:Uncharacterized protein n=1 Tax=Ktedonobacter robiniae TaxID=2778365 RepID=A0ABQ3UJ13_9CHLR|nr:hypothetical protein KSB_11920 [Ktedonobacter robiniae]